MIATQLDTVVVIAVLDCSATLPRRSTGSLTGSRTAGSAARTPWITSAHMLRNVIGGACWKLHGGHTPLVPWVDNLYLLAKSAQASIAAFATLEIELQRGWKLQCKSYSKIVLPPRGSSENVPDYPVWSAATAVPCLGHIIGCDGATRSCPRAAFPQQGKLSGQTRATFQTTL